MKVGIAGCGFMGEVHAESYQKLADVQLYAVAERNPEKLEQFSQKFGPLKKYRDVLDMIKDKEIDVIDICLPTPFHREPAILALQQNKHVLLEKPIALTLEDALAIKQAAEASKGQFMVAHVLRFWAQYSVIRNVFKQKQLGAVKEIYASRFNELPLWSEGTWIMEESQSGGLVIDLMIHDIDFVLWNLGKVKCVWSKGIPDEKNFHIQVMAVLEFENGATAYIEGGYLNPQGAGLSSQMRIYGEKALLEMYAHENHIRLTESGGIKKQLEIPSIDGYFEEIAYFVDCIKQNKEPSVITIDEAIESLNVCLALKKALKDNRWVEV
ncbi:Gfo/Idh/MocA family protein [Calditrichota bacterium GD2]